MVEPILLTANPPSWIDGLVDALTGCETLNRHFFASSDMVPADYNGRPFLEADEIAYESCNLFSPLGGHYWLHALRPSFEPFCDISDKNITWRRQAKRAPFNESFHRQYLQNVQVLGGDRHLQSIIEVPDFFGMRALDYARLLSYHALLSDLQFHHQRLNVTHDSTHSIARSRRIHAGLTVKDIKVSDLYLALAEIRKATGINIDTMLHANDPAHVKTALKSFDSALFVHDW